MLLTQKLEEYKLILASGSPRRKEILQGALLPFTVAEKFECEENYPQTLKVEDIASYLSELKSKAYPLALDRKTILITADTVVVLGDKILGKPHSRDEAVLMLKALSGNQHRVITGVTLRNSHKSHTFSQVTKVNVRALIDSEIEFYVDNFKPFDKAGSYGIQEWFGYAVIEGIEGSFFNVMGLPIEKLYLELDNFLAK